MKQILKFLFIISIFLIGSESVYSESSKPLSDEIRDQGMRGENGVPLNTSEKKVPRDHTINEKELPERPERFIQKDPDEVRPANTKQNTICSEYIQNGAFIDGEEWFGSPSANVTLTTLDGGEKVAAISTKNDNTAYLWQPLYIPHGAVDGSLSFRVESPSQEYSGEDLYISFWDENNYAPVMNQALIDSVPLSGWNDFNFTVTELDDHEGQVINLMFELRADSDEYDSIVWIDDISFDVCVREATRPDSYEPDNGLSQATRINHNTTQSQHSINPANDGDWVYFTLDETSSVRLTTSGSSGDTRLWLYNSDLDQVGFDDDHGEGLFSVLTFSCDSNTPLIAGQYYAKIDEYNQDNVIGAYNISLFVEKCNNPAKDRYEPDDVSGRAKRINSGESQSHSIVPADDIDWVYFTLDQPSSIELRTIGSSGDTRLYLLSDDRQIAFDDDSGPGTFSKITYNCNDPLAAGTYYVKVDEYGQNDQIAGYQLSMTITEQCEIVDTEIDLTIALHHSTDSSERDIYQSVFNYFAEGIYEMSNGLHTIGTITVYENTFSGKNVIWHEAFHPRAHISGYHHEGPNYVQMSDRFGATYNIFSSQDQLRHICYAGYTFAHEWGHYYYGLSDEYLGSRSFVPNSVMGSQYRACPSTSDFKHLNFSVPLDFYAYNQHRETSQFKLYGASGWEVLTRLPSQDPRNPRLLARHYFPELSQRAPSDNNRASIELPKTSSDVTVEWISGAPTALGTEFQAFIAISNNRVQTDDDVMTYPEPIVITAKAMKLSRFIARASLNATITMPDNTEQSFELFDNGILPDEIAEDGFYTGILNYDIPGEYRIRTRFTNSNNQAVFSDLSYDEVGVDNTFEPVDETFEIEGDASFEVVGVKNDDHSDTTQQATVIVPNNDDIAGRIDKQADKDVFELKSSENQAVVIRTAGLLGNMRPKIRILAGDSQSVLAETQWTENDLYPYIQFDLRENQTVYIEVSHVNANQETGYYNVSVGPSLVGEAPSAYSMDVDIVGFGEASEIQLSASDDSTDFRWYSNIDEVLGNDNELSLDAANLSAGVHTISLQTQDGSGNWTTVDTHTLSKMEYEISSGWTAVSLPALPSDGYDTTHLMEAIQAQGGCVEKISEWTSSGWSTVSINLSQILRRDLSPGKPYFVKTDCSSTLMLMSELAPSSNSQFILQPGWNFVTLPLTLTNLKGADACTQVEAQGGKIQKILRWQNGRWSSYSCGLPINFGLNAGESYFIRSEGTSTWSPENAVTVAGLQHLATKTVLITEDEFSQIYLPIISR